MTEPRGQDDGPTPRPYFFTGGTGVLWTLLLRVVVPGLVITMALGWGLRAVRAAVDPAQSVTAAPEDQAPEVPDSLSGEVTWTRLVDGAGPRGLYQGSRGAVLVTDQSVLGLSAQDGATTWSYTWPHHIEVAGSTTSPDGTHLVLTFRDGSYRDDGSLDVRVLVLDTATGGAVADRLVRTMTGFLDGAPVIQVTNSAVLVGQEVLSLKDGASGDGWRDRQKETRPL